MFGRWISESIPYGLASSNARAARILAKVIMEQTNNLPANHQHDFDPETNVSPRN